MRKPRRSLLLLSVMAGVVVLPASAAAASVGAAYAPTGPRAGGAEFGQPNGRPSAAHPVATTFRLGARTVTEGRPLKLAMRFDQRGVKSVLARVAFRPVGGNGTLLSVELGRVRTGALLHPAWPSSAVLKPGRYVVTVHAQGPAGGTLLRRAHASGKAPLTVKAKPAPVAPPPPVAAPPVVSTPGASIPAAPDPGLTHEGVFPVAGAHTLDMGAGRFGTGRTGHTHQGQDILAAEGLPVVAPLAGTIVARDDQPSSAGYYLTENAVDGRAFFFAHCQADSFAVTLGQTVVAGQPLCRVGHTGDATGPHLHFEIWIGGWRTSKDSAPIDPLAQLQAWDN
jgi:hypothetical protein